MIVRLSTFRKGGAVETGCSDLYDVILVYYIILPPSTAPPPTAPPVMNTQKAMHVWGPPRIYTCIYVCICIHTLTHTYITHVMYVMYVMYVMCVMLCVLCYVMLYYVMLC